MEFFPWPQFRDMQFGLIGIAQGRGGAHGMQKVCSVMGIGIPPSVQGTLRHPSAVRKRDTSAFKEPESSYLRVDNSQLPEPALS